MRKILRTTDKELFTKINSLHFTDEVIVTPKPRSNSISTLLKSINKNKKIVERKNIGDRVILTRIAPFNFNVLMNTKRRL